MVRKRKETAPPEVPVFDTFERWLSDRVDETMAYVVDRLQTS